MARATLPSDIEIEYDTFGSPTDPTVLMIMGFSAQMTAWDTSFCEMIAGHGRHVVRFDNRDCGLSTKLHDAQVDIMAVMGAMLSGGPLPEVPYTLSDMASDAIGLLDHLDVERAHIVGASMGGMIVQTLAIEHPDRLLSAASLMSTVGDQAYGAPTPEAVTTLLTPPSADRTEYIERSQNFAVWSSKKYFDVERTKEYAAASYDRSFYPEGAPRQLGAIAASGDRSVALQDVTTPMLVIHGLDDTLISPSGGERTAELVPGAHLLKVADMGHDLPVQLWPLLTGAIAAHQSSVSSVLGA